MTSRKVEKEKRTDDMSFLRKQESRKLKMEAGAIKQIAIK